MSVCGIWIWCDCEKPEIRMTISILQIGQQRLRELKDLLKAT